MQSNVYVYCLCMYIVHIFKAMAQPVHGEMALERQRGMKEKHRRMGLNEVEIGI